MTENLADVRTLRHSTGCRIKVRSKTPGMVSVRPNGAVLFSYGVSPIRKAS